MNSSIITNFEDHLIMKIDFDSFDKSFDWKAPNKQKKLELKEYPAEDTFVQMISDYENCLILSLISVTASAGQNIVDINSVSCAVTRSVCV